MARITLLSAILLKLQIRHRITVILFLLGFPLSTHIALQTLYVLCCWLCVVIGGWDKISVKRVWRFAVFAEFGLLMTYAVWTWNYQA